MWDSKATELDISMYVNIDKLEKDYNCSQETIIVLGKTINTNKDKKIEDYDIFEFCRIINYLMCENLINKKIAPPIFNPLVLTSKLTGEPINYDSCYCKRCGQKVFDKNIEYKACLLFYFTSTKTKEELNKYFNKDIFYSTGDLPKEWRISKKDKIPIIVSGKININGA